MSNQLLKDFSSTFEELKKNTDTRFGNDQKTRLDIDIKFHNPKDKSFKDRCHNLINFINTFNNISVPPDRTGYTLNYSQGDVKGTFRDTLKVENKSEFVEGLYHDMCHIKAKFYLVDTEISQINNRIVENLNKHPEY
jgi:hypothetical protein